jgi:hypothetical protein
MAPQNKLGKFSALIEIPDSDEESQDPRLPVIIDLTGEESLVLHPSPVSRQPPACQKKDLPTSSASSSQSGGTQPLGSTLRQIFSHKDPETPSITKIGEKTRTSINGLQHQTLKSENYCSIEDHQSLISEEDSHSDDSDVMDKAKRHHQKPTREFRPRNLGSSRPTVLTRAKISARVVSSEATCAEPTGSEEAISSLELLAMEDILQLIKKDMEGDHAAYVNSQLVGALKRSSELQECLPDFTDNIDPFSNIPPLDGNGNPTTEANYQVGPTKYGLHKRNAKISADEY